MSSSGEAGSAFESPIADAMGMYSSKSIASVETCMGVCVGPKPLQDTLESTDGGGIELLIGESADWTITDTDCAPELTII